MHTHNEKDDTLALEHNSIASYSKTIDEEKSQLKRGQPKSKSRTWH